MEYIIKGTNVSQQKLLSMLMKPRRMFKPNIELDFQDYKQTQSFKFDAVVINLFDH